MLARFVGPTGRPRDVPLGANSLVKLEAGASGEAELDHLLQTAAKTANGNRAADERLISVVGIGFGPTSWAPSISEWVKGDFDPEKHPRWPAGTPESQGGRFSPKDGKDSAAGTRPTRLQATGRQALDDATKKAMTLAARRAVRMAAIDTLRLGVDFALDAVPVVDIVIAVKTALDVYDMLDELHQLRVNIDALREFVAGGPRTLEQLRMSSDGTSFPTFDAFKKVDDWNEELAKRFGSAGPGYLYHHIVEQSSGLPDGVVHNTDNIVRIPRLLHEEINSIFSKSQNGSDKRSLHDWLKDQPIEVHREKGLQVLRDLGILKSDDDQLQPARELNLDKSSC